MSNAALAIRLAVRSRIWKRIDDIEKILGQCTDNDRDVKRNLNRELELLIFKLRE